jgi:peptidoglycan/xylan/chitin deacetylase (PgdA/CDA1 family)
MIKKILLKITYYLGLIAGINKGYISAICYHSISGARNNYAISVKNFEKQILKLKSEAKFVSVPHALRNLNKKPKYRVVILTVDDGYKDVKDIIPITEKLNIPVTLFVLSDPKNANRSELDNKLELLTTAEIRKLHSLGWTIGCHSATHPNLTGISQNKLIIEIVEAKKALEKRLGFNVDYFAYPKGEFNEMVIDLARKAGYKAAFSVLPGNLNENSNLFALPRTVIKKNINPSDLSLLLSPTTFLLQKAASLLIQKKVRLSNA